MLGATTTAAITTTTTNRYFYTQTAESGSNSFHSPKQIERERESERTRNWRESNDNEGDDNVLRTADRGQWPAS